MDFVTLANEQLSLTLSPMGAEMQALTTRDGREWLWDGNPEFWTGRAPVLFPMVGRAPEDQVRIEGRSFGMGQHGFARRSLFEVMKADQDSCRFALVDSAPTRQVYPFAFRLVVEYRLDGNAVAVTAEVSNRDERPMPFGFGFHPAFRWPLPGAAGKKHLVRLDNRGEPAMRRLEGGLVKPEVLASPFRDGEVELEHAMFDADAMVFPQGAGAGARLVGGETTVHVRWENLPNFALWSKPGEAPFVCLEPWHGTAVELGGSDALEERPYGMVLEAGGVMRFGMRIELVG